MSSGGKKQSTTTSVSNSGPPAWAQPYFEGALKKSNDLQGEAYTPYGGQRTAGAGMMNPYADNPYTDQMVQQLGTDITNNYQNGVAPSLMGQFNQGGAFGGSAHQQAMEGAQGAFARELGNSSNNLRFGQADAQRGEWTAAVARQQNDLDAQYGSYLDQRDFNANRMGLLNNTLGTITGGTSSNSASGANPNYRSAGQNAAGYAALIASMYGGS